jgi:hypothetical protein
LSEYYPLSEDAFRHLFWAHVCESYRDRKRNTKNIDLSYRRDEIRKIPLDLRKGWLGIEECEQPEIERRLEEFEAEGLITLDPEHYRLTDKGVHHCEHLPRTEA